MRQAYIQDRFMCSSCAIISSIHSAEHACWDSTSACYIHDFPCNTHNKKSHLQAAATIPEQLMCRHAVAKVRLLFKLLYNTLQCVIYASLCYVHVIQAGWYNESVDKRFRLPYEEDVLTVSVISSPEMFEKGFLPFVEFSRQRLSETLQDPLDQCTRHYFKAVQVIVRFVLASGL